MATRDALERSVESSKPAELIEISLGSTMYQYTTAEDTITYGGNDFVPQDGMSRGKVEQGSDQATRNLSLRIPADNPFVALYTNIPPSQGATITIYRLQRDETPAVTVVALFIGTIENLKFESNGLFAEVVFRSLESDLSKNIPRWTYQAGCNNFLYDQYCKIDPALHNHIGAVTVQSGTSLTVTGADASGHNFINGFIRTATGLNFRQVIGQAVDVLTIDVPFSENLVGENVQVFAGCDRLVDGDCATVFDNVAEFGGFAFVPSRDLFSSLHRPIQGV